MSVARIKDLKENYKNILIIEAISWEGHWIKKQDNTGDLYTVGVWISNGQKEVMQVDHNFSSVFIVRDLTRLNGLVTEVRLQMIFISNGI